MSVNSGWGRFTWGQAEWNEDATLKTGWGAQAWSGDGGSGVIKDISDNSKVMGYPAKNIRHFLRENK